MRTLFWCTLVGAWEGGGEGATTEPSEQTAATATTRLIFSSVARRQHIAVQPKKANLIPIATYITPNTSIKSYFMARTSFRNRGRALLSEMSRGIVYVALIG
jgi:hypothetical protein